MGTIPRLQPDIRVATKIKEKLLKQVVLIQLQKDEAKETRFTMLHYHRVLYSCEWDVILSCARPK